MIEATIDNIKHYSPDNGYHGVFAYSEFTGEEFSADPGDYFWVSEPDWVMRDSAGNPMTLVRCITTYVEVDDRLEHQKHPHALIYGKATPFDVYED